MVILSLTVVFVIVVIVVFVCLLCVQICVCVCVAFIIKTKIFFVFCILGKKCHCALLLKQFYKLLHFFFSCIKNEICFMSKTLL